MSLKLEKDKKSKKIFLSVKNRTKIYTPDFALAFFIALAIHLMALFLFQIEMGDFFAVENPLAASFVSIDSLGTLAYAPDEEGEELAVPSYLEIKRQESPYCPSYFLASFHESLPLPTFQPSLEDILHENPLCKSHFRFSKGMFSTEQEQEFFCEGERKAAFAFRLDGTSIFWLELLESTGDLKLDKAIEGSLKKLYVTSHDGFKEGILEVMFLP